MKGDGFGCETKGGGKVMGLDARQKRGKGDGFGCETSMVKGEGYGMQERVIDKGDGNK